jgi:hypothetical protein
MSIFWKKSIPIILIAIVPAVILGFVFDYFLVVTIGFRNFGSIDGFSMWFLLGIVVSYAVMVWGSMSHIRKHLSEYEKEQVPAIPDAPHNWREDNKRAMLYGTIDTIDEARSVIRGTSNGIYTLAIIQIALWALVISFLYSDVPATYGDLIYEIPIDAAILAVLSFSLRKFNSRTVASTLFILSLLAFVNTSINRVGGGAGGTNFILAGIFVWTAVRALYATVTYHRLRKQSVVPPATQV